MSTVTGPDDTPTGQCPKCGMPHFKHDGTVSCSAHQHSGQPCLNRPIRGSTVCSRHNVNPQAKDKAAMRDHLDVIGNRIALELADVPARWMDQHPVEGLLHEIGRSRYFIHWLCQRIAELQVPDPHDPLPNVVGVTEDGDAEVIPAMFRLYGYNHNGDLGVHPLWTMLNGERDRYARLCKLAIDANISERMARLEEAQVDQMIGLLAAVLDSLDLDPDARRRAELVAADRFRVLDASSTPA